MKYDIEENRDLVKDHLREAFWILYTDHEVRNVTVKGVCEKAGYNRATFYHYYRDTRDVLEQIEKEILDQFDERFSRLTALSCRLDFPRMVKYTLAPCTIYDKYLAAMLGADGDAKFQSELKEKTKSFLRSLLKNKEISTEMEYYLEFCVSGIFACTREWYLQRETMDIHEYISMVMSFIQLPLFDIEEDGGD